MIAQSTIDEILERVSLSELVAEGVALKRRGSTVVGLCPFHSEKSPSFHIRDDRIYHCFGCGVSGNAISYVMRARGLGFPEAIEELASRLGISIVFEGKRASSSQAAPKDKLALYAANAFAMTYFRDTLYSKSPTPDVLATQEYLVTRGVSLEAQEAFKIGLAPRVRDGLRQFLARSKVSESTMLAAGLVKRSDRGEIYDTFRARLVFPIYSDNKHIVGFGGRIIPALVDQGILSKAPKYLNSSDSPVYHKQQIFFGIPQALAAIREEKEVYLVEGYLDVVGLWQVGVRSVLATCGTAITQQHIRRLKYLTRRVVLLFDGDQAGRAAAGKSFPHFINSGIDVAVVFLPPEHDPDSFARLHGQGTREELQRMDRVPLVECFVDGLIKNVGASSANELGGAVKGRLCEDLVPMLREVKNTIEQNELIQRSALKVGVDPALLSSMVFARTGSPPTGMRLRDPQAPGTASTETPVTTGRSQPAASSKSPANPAADPDGKPLPLTDLPKVDQELLRALMAHKEELPRQLLLDPDLSTSVHPVTFRFAQALHAIMSAEGASQEHKKEDLKALLDEYGETWRAHWRESYRMDEDREVKFDRHFEECRIAYRRRALSEALHQIELRARVAESEAERMELIQQSFTLKRQLSGGFVK